MPCLAGRGSEKASSLSPTVARKWKSLGKSAKPASKGIRDPSGDGHGSRSNHQVLKISRVLLSQGLNVSKFLEKYHITLSENIFNLRPESCFLLFGKNRKAKEGEGLLNKAVTRPILAKSRKFS